MEPFSCVLRVRPPAQVAMAQAESHAALVSGLATRIAAFQSGDMGAAAEYVRDAEAQLALTMADETAVLAAFPAWPRASPHVC